MFGKKIIDVDEYERLTHIEEYEKQNLEDRVEELKTEVEVATTDFDSVIEEYEECGLLWTQYNPVNVTKAESGGIKYIAQDHVIGYKFVMISETDSKHELGLATIIIPRGEEIVKGRSMIDTNGQKKMRTSKAYVYKIETYATVETSHGFSINKCDEREEIDEAYSSHDNDFTYEAGQFIEPENEFDDSLSTICTDGIHFFGREKHLYRYLL